MVRRLYPLVLRSAHLFSLTFLTLKIEINMNITLKNALTLLFLLSPLAHSIANAECTGYPNYFDPGISLACVKNPSFDDSWALAESTTTDRGLEFAYRPSGGQYGNDNWKYGSNSGVVTLVSGDFLIRWGFLTSGSGSLFQDILVIREGAASITFDWTAAGDIKTQRPQMLFDNQIVSQQLLGGFGNTDTYKVILGNTTSGNHKLEFFAIGEAAGMAYLDNISINGSSVPEPSILVMFIFGGFTAARVVQRNQKHRWTSASNLNIERDA